MKKEFPEEDELLLGTVAKLVGTSVFVQLEEYDKEGVISLSEVAPGRIRNIRDYVKPGQKIVVKVLRVDKVKEHIDLSLRRVSAKEKKEILEKHEKEKEVAVMLGLVIKDKARVDEIIKKVKEAFSPVELLSYPEKLQQFGLSNEEIASFAALVAEKEKEKFITIKAELLVSTESEEGIEKIKKFFTVENVEVKYISAPRYLLIIKDKNYKEANKKLKETIELLEARAEELGLNFEVKK